MKKSPSASGTPTSSVSWIDRPWIACVGLFCLGMVLFLINIQFPRNHNFDEFHYVPSAKQFLDLKVNQNWEHPPLGKLIMAASIGTWGDRPIGWRFASTVFGSLTLVGMYLWALAVFRRPGPALWVACLTLCNHLLYVQSRIGMLDTFMFAFIVWGLAAFCHAYLPPPGTTRKQTLKTLYAAGAFFGLATACKWFAVMPWAFVVGLFPLVRLLQYWKTSFGADRSARGELEQEWYSPTLWKDVRALDYFLALVVTPLLCSFATFIPYFFIPDMHARFVDLFLMQKRMWEGQLRVVNNHPYMSQWTDWALIQRPIWYAFDKEGAQQEWVRGVLLIGNPWIMWTGLIAVALCLFRWLERRSRAAFLIFAFYSVFYFSWMLIPRKVSFYYYYYPAGMTLSLALAYVMEQFHARWVRWAYLGVSFALFVYFFPILSAIRVPAGTFRNWTWFRSWI
jgi:dolichyl-phosphate-mannose--protein O-mannosyl transferase